ncbi:hypothetical protein H8D85_02345 [bacterium]|nr:hypothetical protein [bacterium]
MSINVTNLGTQSFLNNVLNNTNNVGNFSTLTEVNPLTTNIPTAINGFKTGANHRFGLVYYDRGNRSSSVKLSNTSSVYIPRIAESGFNGTWSIGWEINHDPPVWATHYQWVYGGNTLANDFISFVTGGFYDGTFAAHIPTPPSQIASGDYSGNILLDITNIKRFRNSEGGILSYDWEEGDIIRFVRDAQDNALPNNQDWEFKVLGVVGQTEGMPSIDVSGNLQGGSNSSGVFLNEDREYLVLSREAALTPLLNTVNANAATFQNYTIEIYSPSKRVEEEDILYYEFGQKYDISNGLHDGETQDQTQINGVAGTGATGTFTRGDVYLRLRASKSSKPFTPVESFHSSDLFKSDYYDKGRPNALLEDFKQTRKHSTCFYSEQYIANTHINGLSSFFPDVSFQEFERSYNSIQKLHSRDNQLIIFQEDKVSKSLVNRNIIYNIDGSGNVATSDTVLSQTVPYLGNYGICRNPESFAANGNKMYFVDIKRGVVLRLSLDGMTPISEYKMKDYFTDKCEEILKYYNPKTYNIFGVYDAKFGEYVVAFDWIRVKTGSEPGGGGGGQGAKLALPPSPPVFNSSTTYTVLMDRETVGFCEYSNRWNSFYSFYPEMMVESGVGFVSFYNGALWHHNRGLDLSDNPLYNAWYGYGVTSELTLVSNDAPSNNKIYNAISEEADDVWSVIVNTKNGQTTNLIKTDFDTKENIHYSQLYNDTNSPGGLLEGDKIRNTSALFKLWTNINTLTRLFAVNFNITPSYRSNK